ncbi:MAG: Sua5/YciO/YrdC/YwlC family protein [Deltaproteobacteria bacterium]|nr:Sua5/YciO/YrdC/YwlC family protein [Deltaproteobacteria bacterium]
MTSANPTGKKPAVAPEEVLDYFNGRIEVLIDGGALPGKTGSTVVDVTSGRVVVIREGEIPLKYLTGPIK